MRKIYLSLLAGVCGFMAQAQLPVSTSAENKNVVLEEYTGIYCTFCPDGHRLAADFKANNPGDVVLINYHIGGYANPQGNDPDFRTTMGTLMTSGAGIAGYPAGSINRRVFSQYSQQSGGMAMSRGDWDNAGNVVLAEPSYVNMAMDAYVDLGTGDVTVDVEVYYTGNAGTETRLFVVLMQNDVPGPQTGASRNPSQIKNGQYMHQHMFRDVLTSRHGDVIDTTNGKLVKMTYTYKLPQDIKGVNIVPGNMEVAGFIAEGTTNIITGADAHMSYGFVSTDEYMTNRLSFYPNPAKNVLRMDVPNKDVKNASVSIYDLSGKKILQLLDEKAMSAASTRLFDISSLEPGSYIIKSTIDGESMSDKLLVN